MQSYLYMLYTYYYMHAKKLQIHGDKEERESQKVLQQQLFVNGQMADPSDKKEQLHECRLK